MAFGAQPVDMNYFLAQKYALLKQQADAGTTNAASGAIQANANAIASGAAANLDNTKATLLPGESAAQVALQRAQTNLTANQASVVVPESTARISQIGADIGLTTANTALVRHNLTPYSIPGTLGAVTGASRLPSLTGGYSLSDPLPPKRPGETEAAYQDRINNL